MEQRTSSQSIDRPQLGVIDGERRRFIATFARVGGTGPKSRTVLLQDVKLEDDPTRVLTDHVWFAFTKGFRDARLQPGDIVSFNARVKTYKKGYWGSDPKKKANRPPARVSYGLERPLAVVNTGLTGTVVSKQSRREQLKHSRVLKNEVTTV